MKGLLRGELRGSDRLTPMSHKQKGGPRKEIRRVLKGGDMEEKKKKERGVSLRRCLPVKLGRKLESLKFFPGDKAEGSKGRVAAMHLARAYEKGKSRTYRGTRVGEKTIKKKKRGRVACEMIGKKKVLPKKNLSAGGAWKKEKERDWLRKNSETWGLHAACGKKPKGKRTTIEMGAASQGGGRTKKKGEEGLN